jgi:hypothetical protein
MPMNILLLILSLTLVYKGTDTDTKKSIHAQMTLSANKIAKPGLPAGSNLFVATLGNNGKEAVPVEVIQLPPEYGGGGALIYPCSFQVWNSKSHRWSTLFPNKLSDHPYPQVIHTEIKPAEKLQVCHEIISNKEIKAYSCGRFALSFRWDHKPEIFSNEFSLQDKSAACRN